MVSGAEVAFFGISGTDQKEMEEKGTVRDKWVLKLLEKPRKLLATILIANNALNIGVVLLLSSLGDSLFPKVDQIWFGFVSVRFLLEIVLATFLILLFGEILPKIYANRNRMSFSRFMALPLRVLQTIFYPLNTPMAKFSGYFYNRLGKQRSSLNVGTLSQALELTSEGDTTVEEQKILEGIVSFGQTDTKQVMRPRIDIFALNSEAQFPEVINEIKKHGYSRIPVFSENIDTITGVLYVKDLLPFLDKKNYDWLSLIREPYFVPENKKLDDLLAEFQEKKIHLSVVVDEYGGTSGIVTLEDIIEEIVGDISDEFDDEDLIYSKIDEHNYVFDGKTNLKDFYRVIALEDETLFEDNKGESETIAGFVLEIAGNFPKRGEKVLFRNYQFVVESLDRKRLKQIKITLPNA
jgi:gliding motility-associated protein GldE